ncbi:MAG: cell division protein FtsW (lipid II flippase) [Acidimicrobiales bacterium]|jgi:cell division protein FtsW (lipid II flippase)
MRPRTVELGLLILASLITVSAYGLTSLGRAASLPANIVPFLGIVLVLLLVAHLVVRRFAPLADGLLLPLAALLNGLGYVVIARLDADLAASQSAWTFIGLGGFAVTLILMPDVRRLEPYRYSLALLGVIFLLLPLIPKLGVNINGARIWLRVGPFSIQPGEFAKVVLAAFMAGYLVDKRQLLTVSTRRLGPLHLPDLKHFGPLLLAWGMALVVMIAERDLGSSLLFFTLFVVMLYLATGRTAYVLIGLVMFSLGSVVAFRMFDHVQRRVDIWLDPFADPKGAGFQIVEAAFALADGGITGTGLGLGTPGKIPFAATDMIFAAIGEELGLLGATAVLATFVLFVAAGFRVASQTDDTFEKLLAGGLTALLGFQTFVIVGGILRVLPLTGVTLPFVSYGGSSLISNYIILALLVRISHRSNAERLRVRSENS